MLDTASAGSRNVGIPLLISHRWVFTVQHPQLVALEIQSENLAHNFAHPCAAFWGRKLVKMPKGLKCLQFDIDVTQHVSMWHAADKLGHWSPGYQTWVVTGLDQKMEPTWRCSNLSSFRPWYRVTFCPYFDAFTSSDSEETALQDLRKCWCQHSLLMDTRQQGSALLVHQSSGNTWDLAITTRHN